MKHVYLVQYFKYARDGGIANQNVHAFISRTSAETYLKTLFKNGEFRTENDHLVSAYIPDDSNPWQGMSAEAVIVKKKVE